MAPMLAEPDVPASQRPYLPPSSVAGVPGLMLSPLRCVAVVRTARQLDARGELLDVGTVGRSDVGRTERIAAAQRVREVGMRGENAKQQRRKKNWPLGHVRLVQIRLTDAGITEASAAKAAMRACLLRSLIERGAAGLAQA